MTNPIPVQGLSEGRVTLAECPVGLFVNEHGGLCLKTEYGNNEGRIDAYIVSSGEFFWGAAPQTIASQRASLVTPVSDALLTELQHSRAEATVAENVTVAPDGWVLVPREPTPEMTDAMWDAAFRKGGPANVVVGYRNAVAVAPASPASPSATGVRVTFADLKRRAEDALDALTAYAHNNEALEDACGESDKAMDAATWNRVKAEQALSAIRDMSFKSAPPALSALVEQP